jgi:transposase-like protein
VGQLSINPQQQPFIAAVLWSLLLTAVAGWKNQKKRVKILRYKNRKINETENHDMTLELDTTSSERVMEALSEHGLDGISKVLATLLNETMKAERSMALGAKPYERSEERKGYANGFKPKTMLTRYGKLELQIPQARGLSFYPKSLEKGCRSEKALKLAIAEMYVKGVSTRRVAAITEELCGHKISSNQVSKISKILDKEVQDFKNRRLEYFPYVYLDARYERVRVGGLTRDCAVLIAIGINHEGKREVLGFSVSLSEAQTHWTEFLKSLVKRKLYGVEYIVSDDHKGLRNAILEVFSHAKWQRCQFHYAQNAQHYAGSKAMKPEIAQAIRDIFNSGNIDDARRKASEVVEQFEHTNPAFAHWLDDSIEETFSVYEIPRKYRIKLRTVNPLENLNREIKRRTRLVSVFPNTLAAERLIGAILMEKHDDWLADTSCYINMDDKRNEDMKKRSRDILQK